MNLFKLFGTIAVDNTEANRAIDDTTRRAEESGKKQNSVFAGIGSGFGKMASGLAIAGAAVGGAFVATVEGTREYRKEMGLLESSFLTAGHSSETAKNVFSDLNAVMGDSGAAVEASQHLAKITDEEKELQTWTDICTGVYSEFGNAIPIESLTESALEVQKNGQLTGGLVDALVWAGINEDEFQAKLDACTTEQERQDLIMNTLNDTYKDASAQYKETNKDILEAEKANEKLKDAFAKLGEVGEPIMTRIKEAIAKAIETAVPKLESLIEKFKDVAKWVKDNEDTIQTWVGVIAGATVAIGTFLLILNWGTIMTAAAQAVSAVRNAIIAMNAAMMANPIGIIVALIVGLVATFIYLWNNVDGFKQFWLDAWEVIKNACAVAWEWIKTTWSNVGEWFKEKFEAVKQAGKDAMENVKKFFSDAWNGIKVVWSVVQPYFSAIWNHIKLVFSVVKNVLTGNFSGAWEGIKGIWNNAKSFFLTVWNGIAGIFGSVGSWFGEKFRAAWSAVKNAFSGFGSFFSGLWSNVKNGFGDIGAKIGETMGGAVKTAMNTVIGKIEGAINKGIGLINKAIGLANKLGFSVGKVEKLNLPRLEKGGVLEKGQVGLLEGTGAEAVVPLEKNTGWIDSISKRISDSISEQYGNDSASVLEQIRKLLAAYLPEAAEKQILLDSGVLVGKLAKPMNRALGALAEGSARGM